MISEKTNFTPRLWQYSALNAFTTWYMSRKAGDSRTFTAAITGGAGKTHIGAMIEAYLYTRTIENVVIICPSNTISQQWIDTMAVHGTVLDVWQPGYGTPYPDVVTTYHMMNNHAGTLNRIINLDTLVIFDECHHLADSAAWGDSARLAAKDAGIRVMLTGTPFREDDAKIPYVTYKDGVLVTNYEYTYGEALDHKHVRPVYFKALDANSHWKMDQQLSIKNLHDDNSYRDFSHALNAAIDHKSAWLKAIIEMAHQQLSTIRRNIPDAAAIITCRDQQHAKQVQRLIQKLTKTNPILAISEDASSDEKIEHFRDSNAEWLVVVRKGSEGMDIPRLQVGVWATNITKQLSFLQFLWRIIRIRDAKQTETAHFFMPAHPKLIEYAESIRDMRTHTLNEVDEVIAEAEEIIRKPSDNTFEVIDSKPGELTELGHTSHPDDTLDIVIRIQELAAWAIGEYARTQEDISLNVALYDIRAILDVPVKTIQTNDNSQSPADDYEQQRQLRAFEAIFKQVKNGKDWWRDVLSFMHHYERPMIDGRELAQKLNMSESRFTSNWKRDVGNLIETGLIDSRIVGNKRIYKNKIEERLEEIAPDHDTAKLVGYLVTGKMGEDTNATS